MEAPTTPQQRGYFRGASAGLAVRGDLLASVVFLCLCLCLCLHTYVACVAVDGCWTRGYVVGVGVLPRLHKPNVLEPHRRVGLARRGER